MFKLILFASLIIHSITDDVPFKGDSNWCVPAANSTGPPIPTLPVQFQTVVEANYRTPKSNFTVEFDEYYDYLGNRGLLVQYALFSEIRQYFLYDTDEMLTVIEKECFTNTLNKTDLGTPFGYEKVNGTAHIFSPINALRLEYTQVYIGEEIERGITVQRWNSCVYIEELNATARITWSFSSSNVWNSIFNISVPVEMRLEGRTDIGEVWEQRYEYIRFRPYLVEDREIFETPVGVFCPGRKPTKSLPKIPPHFSFRIEATSPDLNISTNQAEWYDDESKLVRLDHQTLLEEDIEAFGKTSLTEIHDFNRGIRFIIDRKNEKCLNYTVLDPLAIDADYSNNTKFVRLRTAIELFNFDKNASVSYQYQGSRKVRNIDCDVWIAEREAWPPQPNLNRTSIWEWYFMSVNWTNYNYGIEEYNIPVRLIITNYNYIQNSYIASTVVYNYFDYNQEKPDIFAYDLQYCFDDLKTKHLMFKLDTPYTKITTNRKEMKYAVLTAISKLGYLLPTRITDIEVEVKSDETLVLFKLLDKLPIRGDVENPVTEISLSDAYSLIEKSINSGEFTVNINGTALHVVKKSLKEVNIDTGTAIKGKTLYIVIGTGIGGLVVGIIAVLLISFIIRKKNGNEQPVLRMSGLMNPNFRE